MYIYVNVYDMYVHVCTMYVHYLRIHSMKAVFWHIKWIISGTHDAPAQFWVPFHTPKGSQGTINHMSLQNMIQLCRGPTTVRLFPLISFVGKSQLILQVLTNPLCQFGWQPTQDKMSSHVYELQPLWRGFWWAWEDWCWGTHNQLNFLSWPAKHSLLYGYTCAYMHVTGMNIYVHVCNWCEHVHTHSSFVCTWIRQNITNIMDCVC